MKYTQSNAEANIASAAKYYINYISGMREKELFARAEYDFKHDKDISPYIPAKSANKVDMASYQIVTDIPSVEIRDVLKPRSAAESDKAIMLLYLNTILEKSEVWSNVPPIREFAVNIPTYGAMIGRVRYLPELHEKCELPVVIESINPKCGYPWGRNCFITRYSRTIRELQETIEEWNDETEDDYKLIDWQKKDKDSEETLVDWIEIEYPDYKGIWLGRENSVTPLYRASEGLVVNEYGMITHVHKYSGWAATNSDNTPEHLARGINDYCYGPYKVLASLMTGMACGVNINMFGRDVMTQSVAQGYQVVDGVVVVPDGTTNGSGDKGRWQEKPPELNPTMIQLLGLVIADIDEATLYDNLGGDKLPGVSSGVMNSQLLGQGKLKERIPGHQIEVAVKDLLEKAVTIADKFSDNEYGPFVINGKDKLSPKNIHLPVNLKVCMEPQDAKRDQGRIDNGIKIFAAKLATWREVREQYLKLDNTSGARKEMIIDAVITSPTMVEAVGAATLQEWGMAELAGSMDQKNAANMMMDEAMQPPQSNSTVNVNQMKPDAYQPQQLRGQNMPYSKQIPQDQTGQLNQSDVNQEYGGQNGGY